MNRYAIHLIITFLFSLIGWTSAKAGDTQTLPTDLKASLIYVSPGYTAYTAHGHCALRMQCPSQHLDYCFTYGLDDNSQSYMSFFSGKGMGRFSTCYTRDYLHDYQLHHRQVSEFELNLSLNEKRNLWALLDSELSGTSLPYDYLRTNCSSMCAHAVENILGKETIEYTNLPAALQGTYRDFVLYISRHKPWISFFWNTLLGAEGELSGSLDDKLSPALLVEAWSNAAIIDTVGARRPMFAGNGKIILSGDDGTHETPFSPILIFSLLLMLIIGFTLAEKKFHLHKAARIVDGVLLTLQTIVGIFICYMAFISILPGTSGSWYVIVFNPLPALLWLTCRRRHWYCHLLLFYTCVLLLFILLTPVIPQLDFEHALLEAIFAVRCAADWLKCRKNRDS
ncbi:MAG: DUF4105 domain-containing protein [Prevotella sp.]|jgi:hypothetical protein